MIIGFLFFIKIFSGIFFKEITHKMSQQEETIQSEVGKGIGKIKLASVISRKGIKAFIHVED